MEQKYRKLETGDTIQDGDEVWEFGRGPWGPVSRSEHGQQYRNGYNEMRRPVAAEETIDEVREAWQKDHMEMKRKLDAVVAERMGIERMWFKQRDELSDARNQITDLTKERDEIKQSQDKIKDLSCKFLGIHGINAQSPTILLEKELERYVDEEHIASWAKIQKVLPESVRNLDLSLVDQVVKCITDLGKVDNAAQNWQDIKVSKNGETHALGTLIPLLESQIASAERERDNWMETAAQHSRNQEFYHGLVTDIGNMFGLRARISDDGTICEGVLALRVPELVAELIVENS